MPVRRSMPPLALLTFVSILGLSACTSPAAPAADSPTPAPSASRSATSVNSPAPAPSADDSPIVFSSCDEMITPAFRQMVADNGWVGWNMVGQPIGHSPFDRFPDGAPAEQLSCRFGAGPEVATDNVLDLAWAPIGTDRATVAQAALQADGFERIDVPEGTQWATRPGQGGWEDDEGWGEVYLFTDHDVRWALARSDLNLLRSAA